MAPERKNIRDIIKAVQGIPDEELASTIFVFFKNELERAYAEMEVSSYEGVEELLSFLRERGVKLALNTGYDRNTAQLLLNKMNWKRGQHYDLLITSDDVVLGRPNPDMIFEAMNFFGIEDPALVLKAGDSIIDIEEGKNAKCGITVGVTTGAHTFQQLQSAEPTYVLKHLLHIKEIPGLNQLPIS